MTDLEWVRETAAKQHGVITLAQCEAAGVPVARIRAECRSRQWRPLCRGTYLVDAGFHEETPRLALLSSALLMLGPTAAAILDTAAELEGIQGLPRRPGPLHVSRPPDSARRHRDGVAVHHLQLPAHHVRKRAALSMTTPARTVIDLMCRLPRWRAVAVADSAMNQDLVGRTELAAMLCELRGRRGIRRARTWLGDVDGGAQSPLETRVRLRCVDGGVPPEASQHPVYAENGVLLGIADFAWPSRGLLVEADGADPHEAPTALFRDRRRQNDLMAARWIVLRFTWQDTWRRGYVAAAVRRALVQRRVRR